jgi:D-3-phosphoglycerate dehydrogenase
MKQKNFPWNMGKAFAKKLRGFEVETICYDIKDNVGDENARQVSLDEFREKCDVVSLHTPWTLETDQMINKEFIDAYKKPLWFINTARGKSVVTEDLVNGLRSGKVLGAGLDVLEYEKSSFEDMFTSSHQLPQAFQYLMKADNVY